MGKAVKVLVVCHTRELAYQIKHEFDRFAKYFTGVKCVVVYGGIPIAKDKEMLKDDCPHIMIGTPGRVLALSNDGDLKLEKLTHFILDECDKCLEKLDMRGDIQKIFLKTPKKKQVMMFSATMDKEIRLVCKKFMSEPHEISIDIERVNIVINSDMPGESDSYLHRVGRAGRFGTKGLAISFCSGEEDAEVLKKVQSRFEVNITEMPAQIDTTAYINA